MTEFYSREETERKKRVRKRRSIAAWCAAIAGLLTCVCLCFQVRTRNAMQMLVWVIGVSVGSGWTVILLNNLSIAPLKADIGHSEGMLRGQSEFFEGEIHLDKAIFRIPRSIPVRKVRLISGEEPILLNVSATNAEKLPVDGTRVRVRTVNRYIAGCEVCYE